MSALDAPEFQQSTTDNIEKVKKIITVNRRITIREVVVDVVHHSTVLLDEIQQFQPKAVPNEHCSEVDERRLSRTHHTDYNS